MAEQEFKLNAKNMTSAVLVTYAEGHDYVVTNKNVFFGRHFVTANLVAGSVLGTVWLSA